METTLLQMSLETNKTPERESCVTIGKVIVRSRLDKVVASLRLGSSGL